MTARSETGTGEGVAATGLLWLDTLQRISGRSAHELRGALNGVSVNLEVVRSRTAKIESTAGGISVVKYADAAGDQLTHVIAMSEALLSLARAPRGSVEIGAVARRFETLLGAAAKVDGRSLIVDESVDALGSTTADGAAARLLIGASMLAALDASTRVVCRATDDGRSSLRFESCDGARFALPAEVLAAASDAGIGVSAEPSVVSISFPRRTKDGTA
jgi:signal transduction histidine kinase